MSDHVVVGDCGGTNTRLSLWEIPHDATGKVPRGEKAPGTLKFDKKYLNENFTDFVSIMKQFMKDANSSATPKAACLACAGPILDNTVNFTNISSGWFIDGKKLEAELGIPRVLLVNDFTAMGYGLLTLKPEECYVLNDVAPKEGGPVATIGAGTGLGECFLTRDVKTMQYVCWATEGGHTDWPPRDEEEFELLQFLRTKHQQKARVSVERVISGPGIASIYEFLAQKYPEQVDQNIQAEFDKAASLKGGVVAQNADKDKLCGKAMQIFFDAYASEAGNAMLKWLPTGGFFITGGIAAKNLKYISDSDRFKSIMFDKGRVSPAIQQCPVYVAKSEDVGERGAHLVAYNLLVGLKSGVTTRSGRSDSVAAAEAAVANVAAAAPATTPKEASAPAAQPTTTEAAPAQPAATETPAPAPAPKAAAAPQGKAAKKDKKKCVVQ